MPEFVLPLALFSIMLGIGLSLSLDNFKELLRQPIAVVSGIVLQLMMLPVLGWIIVTLLDLPAVYATGLLILTLAPGGATSNMISYLCRADLALSVSLTAISSLITPFTLPVLSLWVASYYIGTGDLAAYPVLASLGKLLFISLLPVILGMLIRHRFSLFAAQVQPYIKKISLIFMLFVVVGIVVSNRHAMGDIVAQASPAVMLLSCSSMLMGWLVAKLLKLSSQQGVTLSVETGIQNAGMALLITQTLLANEQMSAVVLLYGVLMQIPALFLIAYRNLPSQKELACS